MPPRMRMVYAGLLLALLFMSAVALYREFSGRKDIWWTPQVMAVPLSESADRVVVLVRGQPLRTLVDSGQLRIAADADKPVISSTDIAFRFNNYERVRVQRQPMLLLYAAMIGALATLLLVLATGRLAYRPG